MRVKANSVMNLGDTSFRLKNYMQPTKIILRVLRNTIGQSRKWKLGSNNRQLQDHVYNLVLHKAHSILHRKPAYNIKSRFGMRGRGITNAVAKIGLVDREYRRLSPVASDWLNHKLTSRDKLEQILPITDDNLVFFRQLLKLRLYKRNTNTFIRPFIFTLKFLSKYQNVSLHQFSRILSGLNPDTMDSTDINNIINDFKDVLSHQISFGEYYSQHFNKSKQDIDTINKAKKLLNKFPTKDTYKYFPDKDTFKSLFYNRKGNNNKSTTAYFDFVNTLMKYHTLKMHGFNDISKMNAIIHQLITLGKDTNVKKAFGYNKTVFPLTKKEDFQSKFSNSPLLSNNIINIYLTFIDCKKSDRIREYSDMNRRIFSLSAIFNTITNHRANINFHDIWSKLFKFSQAKIYDTGDYKDYDLNPHSNFYKDITTEQILNVTDDQVNKVINETKSEYDLPVSSTLKDLQEHLQLHNEKLFEKIINKYFSEKEVIKLLEEIIKRCNCKTTIKREKVDKVIQNKVMPQTSVPTIFEYLLGIAWYHLSNGKINILPAFNLTMNSDFRPLEQAPGGEGDIEIRYSNNFILLLEATLMDRQAQKRGELEPVIRHSANLKADLKSKNSHNHTQTIYVADKLDHNVDNIFRSALYTELNNSAIDKHEKPVDGVNIFPLAIRELIQLLKTNRNNPKCNDYYIINIINSNLNNPRIITKNDWRTNSIKYFNSRS